MTALERVMIVKRVKQAELAKRLGVSQPAISKQVTKGIYDIRIARRYAEALETDPLFLLEELTG